MAEDFSACLSQALKVLKENWGEIEPSTCLICGSGWGEIVQNLSPVSFIPYENLLGIGKTTVQGHSGNYGLPNQVVTKSSYFKGAGTGTKVMVGHLLFSQHCLLMKWVPGTFY